MSWVSDLVGKVPVIGPAINSVAHNVVDPLARGAVKNIPGGSIALGVGDALGRMVPGGSGGGAPGIQSITDFLSGNNGLNALGAAQGVNAALLGKKSNDLANKALDTTQGQ